MKGDKQFFCRECNIYIPSEEEAIKNHRNWAHTVIRKIPLKDRVIHTCSPYGETPALVVSVNDEKWLVIVYIADFKEGEYSRWRKNEGWHFIGTSILHPPIKNIMATLHHKFPNNPITKKKFLGLIRTAIKQENYRPHGKNTCRIIMVFDSDLKLLKRTSTSKLIVTNMSKIKRAVFREDEDVFDEAWQHAKLHKAPEV